MKAIQFSRFGGPDTLELVEISKPAPGPGEVLVRVKAVGVNLAETLMREKRYAVTPTLPAIPGAEAAGIIEAIGEGVETLALGQRVAAPLFAAGASVGAYAEYVVINAGFAAPLPDALSFEGATALMIQGLTALHLTRQAPPKGKAVLINAAAGGVGSLLVQLAKRAGARIVVAGASSAEKLAFAKGLGADAGVDYSRPNWPEALAKVTGGGPDIIYESVGGSVTTASQEALAPLGRMVIYGALNIQSFALGVPELLRLIFMNQSLTGFAVAPLLTQADLRSGLAELFDLAVKGELKTTIGGRYALDKGADAHRALESRKTVGKLVLGP